MDTSGIQQYLNTTASILSIILLPALLIIGLCAVCPNTKQKGIPQTCKGAPNRQHLRNEQDMYGNYKFEDIDDQTNHPPPPPINNYIG